MTARVAVLGASGFAGAELLRLISLHPELELTFAGAGKHAGQQINSLYPHLAGTYPEMVFGDNRSVPSRVEVAFVALPHGLSQELVPNLDADLVVDLGADFRFKDPSTYERWYASTHTAPEYSAMFEYGLVELFRDSLPGAQAVSVPGCYVTAACLTVAPFIESGEAETRGIVVDAMSGVSGAGREPKPGNTFNAVSENLTAYGLLNHRHTPEMEMALSHFSHKPVDLLFTPHLVPANRGILATCYLKAAREITTDELLHILASAYRDEPFVHVDERPPSTKSTLGSNSIHITARSDPRTGRIVAIGALDNLVKGAAGHAIQGANVALGLDETLGLPVAGLYP